MRCMWMGTLAILLAVGVSWAEDAPPGPPPAEGEEKPKTEEEILQEKIVEILQKLTAADEMDIEESDKTWTEVRDALKALGPKAVPLLETYLPKKNDKGIPVYSEKLAAVMGRNSWEAAELIEKVMRHHRWVSEDDREKLQTLMEDLRKDDADVEDLSIIFAELDWFGVEEGLKKEYGAAKDAKMRNRIVEVTHLLSKQGCLFVVGFLLDLTLDKEAEVRRRSLENLGLLGRNADDEDWKRLDALFEAEKAYPMFVGQLRLDEDTDVRMFAARVLGAMELSRGAEELFNALEDPKDRVQGEALEALRRILKVRYIEKYEDQLKAVKAAWGAAKSGLPKQIRAEKPVRAAKEESKTEEPGKD